MIRRRDHEWLPFWRLDGQWVVSVRYSGPDGRGRIGHTPGARFRIVALWQALRGQVEDEIAAGARW